MYTQLDLQMHPGELVALVGPNGAGKTSLLRDMAGLTPPQQGVVRLGTQALHTIDARLRARQIAYLPQHTPADPDLRVDEVVSLGRAPYWTAFSPPNEVDREAIAAAILSVSIDRLKHRRIGTLSGGERQRVMLARMLATRATCCLLDEPTAALDIGHAIEFLQLCRDQCRREIAMLIAIHDLDLARQFADRVVLLHADGRGTVDVGPTPAVLTPEQVAAVFCVSTQLADGHLVFSTSRTGQAAPPLTKP